MIRMFKRIVCLCVLTCLLGMTGFSVDVSVIKDPKPTVTEKELLPLTVYKTIAEELSDDEFLFMASSVSVNEQFIFIYDRAQAKIYKLDKQLNLITSFGRKGRGPGEFYGTGRIAPVFLNIGQDNKLYAHDYMPRKIMGFSLDGKPIKAAPHNKFYVTRPTIDKAGRALFPLLRNGKIVMEDAHNNVISEFAVPSEYLNYLFTPPGAKLRKSSVFIESGNKCVFTADSKLLIFLSNFSTLVIVSGNKVTGTLKLWPAGALMEYKRQLTELLGKKRSGFAPMFARIIPDQDNKDVFYLHQGSSTYKERKGDTYFAFNLKGELLKTYFIPYESGRVILHAKRDGIFYTTRAREEVILFKEKNHE